MVEEKVVGAKYVLIEDAWMGKKGDLFTLIKDDGTDYPKFSDATGKSVCINIEHVVKLNEQPAPVTATISKEQFDSIKAGDKLVVRSDLTEDTDVPYGITAYMADLAGKTVTVSRKTPNYVEVKEAEMAYSWAKECFTAVIKHKKPKFAVGDRVKVVGNSVPTHFLTMGSVATVTAIYSNGKVRVSGTNEDQCTATQTVAEADLELYTELEFDCPELIYGKIYTDDDGWTFRYCKTKYTHVNAKVTGSPYLSADGGFVNQSDSYIHFYKWRKATTAEVAKLVAAEKENGYVPPLVNVLGTVIEVGKVYAMEDAMLRVDRVTTWGFTGTFLSNKYKVSSNWGIHLGSYYGRIAVPATAEQFALFEAAVAKDAAEKAFQAAKKDVAA